MEKLPRNDASVGCLNLTVLQSDVKILSFRELAVSSKILHKSTRIILINVWLQVVDMTFLSEFNHPNLVKVLGYCFEDQQLFLVYEFMDNGSLDSHLFTSKYNLKLHTKQNVVNECRMKLLHCFQKTSYHFHGRKEFK